MNDSKMIAAVAFAAKNLKKNPEMTLPQMKELGAAEGVSIYPVIMAKAREELGIVAKRGRRRGSASAPKAKAKAASSGRKRSGGSKRKGARAKAAVPAAAAKDPFAAVQRLADHMGALEKEVAVLRDAMARIAKLAGSF